MLETEAGLATWRLSSPPGLGPPIAAELLSVHRREYLDYEGPVSGNRGTVSRWDHGTYTLRTDEAAAREVILLGDKLNGIARLAEHPSSREWFFTFEPDATRDSTV
jgi:hypothetical protein